MAHSFLYNIMFVHLVEITIINIIILNLINFQILLTVFNNSSSHELVHGQIGF